MNATYKKNGLCTNEHKRDLKECTSKGFGMCSMTQNLKKVFFVSTPHPHFLVGSNYFLDLIMCLRKLDRYLVSET